MRTLLLTLVLVIATACYAEEHVAEESGDVLEQERTSSDSISAVEVDESTGRENPYAKYREAEEREKYPWMIVLVDADGEFIDFQDMKENFPNFQPNFRTRVECMENGIHRMEWSLKQKDTMVRNDDGSIGMTYTQYLGFLCDKVEVLAKEEAGT